MRGARSDVDKAERVRALARGHVRRGLGDWGRRGGGSGVPRDITVGNLITEDGHNLITEDDHLLTSES